MQRGERAETTWQTSLSRSTFALEIDYVEYNDMLTPLLAAIHRLKSSVADYRWRLRTMQRSKKEIWGDAVLSYMLSTTAQRGGTAGTALMSCEKVILEFFIGHFSTLKYLTNAMFQYSTFPYFFLFFSKGLSGNTCHHCW